MAFSAPAPISESNKLKRFDCGKKSLNEWLHKNAIRSENRGYARTYTLCEGNDVVGYYCVSNTAISREDFPDSFGGSPKAVPAILLGRLAIHKDHQRKGIGTQLALDAFEKTLEAAKYSGIAAILLHVDEQAALEFWMSLDFKSSQENPKIVSEKSPIALHLPIETVRQALLTLP